MKETMENFHIFMKIFKASFLLEFSQTFCCWKPSFFKKHLSKNTWCLVVSICKPYVFDNKIIKLIEFYLS